MNIISKLPTPTQRQFMYLNKGLPISLKTALKNHHFVHASKFGLAATASAGNRSV